MHAVINVLSYRKTTHRPVIGNYTWGSRSAVSYTTMKEVIEEELVLDSIKDLTLGVNFILFYDDLEYVLSITEETLIDKETNTIAGEFEFYIL